MRTQMSVHLKHTENVFFTRHLCSVISANRPYESNNEPITIECWSVIHSMEIMNEIHTLNSTHTKIII